MTLTLPTNLRALLLAAGTLALAACPDKDGDETDSTTGTASDATSTDATATGTVGEPTTDAPTTGGTVGMSTTTNDGSTATGTDDTMGGMTTSAGVTEGTTAVDTGDDTAEPPPGLDTACQAACDKFFECLPQPPFPDIDTCKANCADALGSGEMCLDLTIAFNHCIGEMTCDELQTALDQEVYGPCQDEFDAMDENCGAAVCEGFGGSDGQGSCSIGQACGDQPTEEFRCEGDTCTCLVGDEPFAMCPAADGFCDLEFSEQAQAALECCGFEF